MKNKKKLIIIAIVLLVLIAIAVTTFIVLKNTVFAPKTEITTIEDLSFEINSEVKLLSLIENIENGTIISEDEVIDTSTLGEKEVNIKYINEKNEEQEYIIKYTIIDIYAPVIEVQDIVEIQEGEEINLLEKAKVTDNSKEEITPTVEGDYDINAVGEYKIKYIAVDSSENRAEKEITLKVNAKQVEEETTETSNNTNNSSTNKTNKSTSNKSSNSGQSSSSSSSTQASQSTGPAPAPWTVVQASTFPTTRTRYRYVGER